jgi:hypothetical protein
MGGLQCVKDLGDARSRNDDLCLSARESAQWSRDKHGYSRVVLHDVTPTQVNVSRDPTSRSSGSAIRRRSR